MSTALSVWFRRHPVLASPGLALSAVPPGCDCGDGGGPGGDAGGDAGLVGGHDGTGAVATIAIP